MRNTMKVQAVAVAAMIAVAVVVGAGEANAAARRAESAGAYGRTLERIPRKLEIAGKSLREVLDGWGQEIQLAKARMAAAARAR
jgi:hypothetical protein